MNAPKSPDQDFSRLAVYVPDAAYDSGPEETYFQRSHEFREELEEEHALTFVEENIGPSADWPAFLGWLSTSPLPYLAGALALFFAGRRIEENLDAWLRMGVRLSRFFHHNTRFDRGGAAIAAISAVLAEFPVMPNSIILVGYRAYWDAEIEEDGFPRSISGIDDDEMLPLNLGRIIYAFQVLVDNRSFIVLVDGSKVILRQL